MKIKKEFSEIIIIFLIWRIVLFILSFIAINFVRLGYSDRFLGGGPINYQKIPYLFSWANFDGEHYLSIAMFGYKGLEQAFFPIYPLLISFCSKLLATNPFTELLFSTILGIVISNLAFLLALIFLYELIKLDFSSQVARWTIILLVVFPTSFYFAALYNESLFLFLSTLSFYMVRRNKWFLSGVLGMLTSATRIFGLFLLPSFLLEIITEKGDKKQLWILLIPFGLLCYMLYQWIFFGDALLFYRLQKIVGEQHQSGITLLPQVYYRYLRILETTDLSNPIYQTIILELFAGILFIILPIYGYFKKVRISYLFYALIGFLTPTIQGSFSSVPRYVIVFFPSFIAFALLLISLPKFYRLIIVCILSIWMCFETMLFLRGYWIA